MKETDLWLATEFSEALLLSHKWGIHGMPERGEIWWGCIYASSHELSQEALQMPTKATMMPRDEYGTR